MLCHVCHSPEAERHFGGITCRACAAFFRRYFRSRRGSSKCTCLIDAQKCRKCRVEKCLSVGMSPDKVQRIRDKLSPRRRHKVAEFSLLVARMIPKDTSNISFAIPNWKEFQDSRIEMTGGKMCEMSLFEVTSTTKMNIDLIWRMVNNLFPTTRDLKEKDRAALVRNFIPKFWMFSPVLDCIENPESLNIKEDEYENMIVSFYEGSFKKGKELSKKEILRIFEPFWWTFYTKTAPPIVGLNLAKEEIMGIIWLLFFDHGYTNISPECQEMCRNLRKVIFQELKNYQNDRELEDKRFFETVETMEIIEKGEQKFMEEMMICEMYNVRIHDDFKQILKENKF